MVQRGVSASLAHCGWKNCPSDSTKRVVAPVPTPRAAASAFRAPPGGGPAMGSPHAEQRRQARADFGGQHEWVSTSGWGERSNHSLPTHSHRLCNQTSDTSLIQNC